jgi:hypothetical protein
VHAVAAFVADRDVGCTGVLDQDLVQMVLVGERADRGGVADEHLPGVTDRPAAPNVVDDCPVSINRPRFEALTWAEEFWVALA